MVDHDEDEEQDDQVDDEEHDDHEHDGEIELPEVVRANLGITFARVERRPVEGLLRVPGAFELEPLARREYRMALPGRVELLVDQYEEIAQGQVLYRFQSPSWPELLHEIIEGEQAIRSTLVEIEVDEARIEEAQAKLEALEARVAKLAEADFKRADLDAAASELAASLPRLAAELKLERTHLLNAERTREHAMHRAALASGMTEADLEAEVPHGEGTSPRYRTVDWIEVRAASAGVVEALAVTNGSFLEAPSMVLSTVDPSRLRFRALALQGDLPRLDRAQSARIVPPQSPGLALEPGVEAQLRLGLEAHPEERTVALLARPVESASWARTGVSAFLEVVVETTGGPVLAIPRRAVVQDGLEHVFFLRERDDPDHVVRVIAHLGVTDGRWVQLLEDVVEGDEVVLDGAYELKLATQMAGGAPQEGHVHADGSVHTE